MAVVNVPNTVEGILADAGFVAPKEEPKAEAKVEEVKTEVEEDGPDDIEGEDGLTPRQKKEFTASMLKTLSKKHGLQKSAEEFATLQYNERVQAERRVAKIEAELNDLRSKIMPPSSDAKPDVEPKRDAFKTDGEYQDALIAYRVDQRLREKEAELAKQQEINRQAEVMRLANERIQTAKTLQPDFEAVVGAADVQIPNHIGAYMQESEMLGELAYHFAKHPEVLENLRKLSPSRSLVEIGKLEGKLSAFSDKAAKVEPEKVTNGTEPSPKTGSVPSPKPRIGAPIKPISAGSVPQVEKDESEMNGREALTKWQKDRGVDLSRRRRH